MSVIFGLVKNHNNHLVTTEIKVKIPHLIFVSVAKQNKKIRAEISRLFRQEL